MESLGRPYRSPIEEEAPGSRADLPGGFAQGLDSVVQRELPSIARAGDAMAGSRTSSPSEAAAGGRDDLLATKLNVPHTRPDHLGRSRLIQRLDEGMARDMLLVCTPAGFGKTTLLADWAASAKWSVAWLSLDPEDNDPTRFWRYVVDDTRPYPRRSGRAPASTPDPSRGRVEPGRGDRSGQRAPGRVRRARRWSWTTTTCCSPQPIHDGMTFLLGHAAAAAARGDRQPQSTRPCPWHGCGPGASLSNYAQPSCGSPPRSRRPCCARRGARPGSRG